jgi:hypothetical protein
MTAEAFCALRPCDPIVLAAAADVPALSPSELLLLTVLLLESGDRWDAIEAPGIALARRTHLNVSSVKRLLSRLRRLGIVAAQRWKRSDGVILPNTYAIDARILWRAREVADASADRPNVSP